LLSRLRIHNFALVDTLELHLDAGLTVFTGETGAGKSILVDALGLALGMRGNPADVRPNCDRAEIEADFALPAQAPAANLLSERGWGNGDGGLRLRRVLYSGAHRSRAYVNDRAVSLRELRELGALLAEVQGQHAHQSLLATDSQRRLLDRYGDLYDLLQQAAALQRAWQQVAQQLEQLSHRPAAELELLRYQTQELQALAPQPGEHAALVEEHRRLAHARRLQQGCAQVLEGLDGGGDTESVIAVLWRLREHLQVQAGVADEAISAGMDLLEGAALQAEEAAGTLRRYCEQTQPDPERLHVVEQRLDAINAAARRHRVNPEQLGEHYRQLQQQLQALEQGEERHGELLAERERLLADYRTLAARLHRRRSRAAPRLADEITAWMQRLGMEKGRFEVQLRQAPGETPHAEGDDQVEFLVTANPGLPPRPMSKVASGGELSRICLALHTCSKRYRDVATLVFDEVDAGIGGATAEIVGRLLRELGTRHQVLCVTHLPQVASQAGHHIKVSKARSGNTTRAEADPLQTEQRVEEIARMLGGVRITARTRAHAREMLACPQAS